MSTKAKLVGLAVLAALILVGIGILSKEDSVAATPTAEVVTHPAKGLAAVFASAEQAVAAEECANLFGLYAPMVEVSACRQQVLPMPGSSTPEGIRYLGVDHVWEDVGPSFGAVSSKEQHHTLRFADGRDLAAIHVHVLPDSIYVSEPFMAGDCAGVACVAVVTAAVKDHGMVNGVVLVVASSIDPGVLDTAD